MKLKAIENESKEKDLAIEEMESEICQLTLNLSGCASFITDLENSVKVKDETIETGLARINSLEHDSLQKISRITKLEEEVAKRSNREQLLERALKKRLKKNR